MGYKTVEVEVEVDIDEFDTDELVSELISRINRIGRNKQMTDKHKKKLLDSIEPLFKELHPPTEAGIEINTIEDEMKRDHLAKIWHKYTSFQLEQLIP